ncbi:unnamed protein product [Dovyalis caffra]|uniref:Zinc finger PHD-type domain-containing protein n=1 Tax=Dovyalis caffra TaxID=77055 RepID=A0AAV1R9G7_9ROSI|nr:unnamed protein product [Dovyalis caffra]
METEEEENSINPSNGSVELDNESNLTTTITTTDTESVAELHESNESQLGSADTELVQRQPQPPESQTETTVLDKSDAQDFVVGESQSVSPRQLVVEGGEGEEVAEATEESVEIVAQQEVVEKEVEKRDSVAKEERNEDLNGNANAGNNERETKTDGVADVAAELETETLSQEVETVAAEVIEVKEELAVAENTEKNDVAEEKKEDADVLDKVEMVNDVEEAETATVKEEEDGVEKTEISGVGNEMEAVERREVTEVVKEGKVDNTEVADVAGEMKVVEQIEMNEIVEEEKVEKMEVNEEEEKQLAAPVEMTDIAEETRKDAKNEMADIAEEMTVAEQIETTDVAGGMEEAINKEGETTETEMLDVAEEADKEEDTEVEMLEKENEGEDMADEMEGAEEEVEEVGTNGGGGGKRKRGKNAKTPSRAASKKKMEEDVCFICFDGGELVLCDRRGCPKAYHPSCVNRDEAFFRAKGRWNCGLMYTTAKLVGADLCEGTEVLARHTVGICVATVRRMPTICAIHVPFPCARDALKMLSSYV